MTKEEKLNITEAMFENIDKIASSIMGSDFLWISGLYNDNQEIWIGIVTQGTVPNPANWDWEREWLLKVRQWQYLEDVDLEKMSEEDKQETIKFFVEESIPHWVDRLKFSLGH